MNRQTGIAFCRAVLLAALSLFTAHAQTAPFSKAQVADRIRKVEDGVDEFDKHLENPSMSSTTTFLAFTRN